jgi:hypothetical protein
MSELEKRCVGPPSRRWCSRRVGGKDSIRGAGKVSF